MFSSPSAPGITPTVIAFLVGRTALDLAAYKGHDPVVGALINAGASIWVVDSITGRTPVHSAAYNGHETCLRYLLDNSQDENLVNAYDNDDRLAATTCRIS